jgi:hypothetical protein
MLIAHIKRCCLVGLILISNVSLFFGQSTIGRFLLFTPSARSSGMGGVGVANDYSPYATYFNPSNLAFSPTLAAVGSFTKPLYFFDNVAHSYFSISTNLKDIGAIGASANFYWKGIHLRTNNNGPEIMGVEELTDWQLKLTYAHSLSDRISVGVGIGILRLALSDQGTGMEIGRGKSNSINFDLGIVAKELFPFLTMSRPTSDENTSFSSFGDTQNEKGISLGIVLRNMGPKITMIDAAQADPVSSTLSFGLSYNLICSTPIKILLASDIENRIYEGSLVDYIHWGGELRLFRIFFVRTGYYQNMSEPNNSYATWGGGIHLFGVALNIAHYKQSLWPSWHFDGSFSMEIL